MIKCWEALLDNALEQSSEHLKISRAILEIDLGFEDENFFKLPYDKQPFNFAQGREFQSPLRKKLEQGEKISSMIQSEQNKIEQLLLSKYGIKAKDILQTERDKNPSESSLLTL
ncbi:hypothetical protein Lgra_0290 [Legionella gratiana]|uniref:Uncharacterized protein n=1 Tax=Legionella gratiana TaxID=45066 RepID=A0A378JAZ5_9GAMM|nr:hypothetical protein [Legionella gratiana]KTD15624.1 hypothetical protein Lgra_0290 [Legionella gratiana]STX44953.1 Uncharacterised protein [Legionella gratiana]